METFTVLILIVLVLMAIDIHKVRKYLQDWHWSKGGFEDEKQDRVQKMAKELELEKLIEKELKSKK